MEITHSKNDFIDIKFYVSLHLELEGILVKIVNFEEIIAMIATELHRKLNLRVVAHKGPENAHNVFHVIIKSTFIFLVFSH